MEDGAMMTILRRARMSVRKNLALCIKVFILLQVGLCVMLMQVRRAAQQEPEIIPSVSVPEAGRHVILWYNPSEYIKYRPNAISRSFEGCRASNCMLTFDRKEAPRSKAVIYDGRKIHLVHEQYQRPTDQLWVWWGNEAPSKYYDTGPGWSQLPFVNSFNLTMTYHRNSDIYIPYGEIVPRIPRIMKDYPQIVATKSKSVLWIASNCHTFSWREKYIEELKKYIDVDIFGQCADDFKPWECGVRYQHDECFQVLNQYRFFLSFENALCEDYITEKFYENYNYDIVLIARGGTQSNFKDILPDDTYIDADDYNGPEKLAKHLHNLMNDEEQYIKLLHNKDQYRSVPYEQLYQRALCDLCDRVSYPETFHVGSYPSIRDHYHESNFCRLPTDVDSKHNHIRR